MTESYKIIAELESDNSKLFKAAIVKREAELQNDELFSGFDYAFNPYITFGVANKTIPVKKANAPGPGLAFKKFVSEIQALIDRKTTGHAARDLVQSLCDEATVQEWNGWYRRILDKDLRCGMSESTVNKVVYGDFVKKKWVPGIAPQYRIEVFECQLAKDSDENPIHMTGKKIVDTKADGQRTITIIDPHVKTVRMFSRNGKEMVNFEHICQQFLSIAHTFKEPMVIDSEMMSKNFQDLMKQARRKTNVDTTDATLNMFDILPLVDFKAGMCNTQQHERSSMLEKWYNENQNSLPSATFLTNEVVDLDTEKGTKRISELKQLAAEAGQEGIMLKKFDAEYTCSRSTNWLKEKPVISVSLTIIDVEAGKEGKKNANCLGAFVCEGVDAGRYIKVNVGSGFDEQQREDFWKNRQTLIGQIAEVEADVITKSQNSNVHSLRFPRFKCFRDDK